MKNSLDFHYTRLSIKSIDPKPPLKIFSFLLKLSVVKFSAMRCLFSLARVSLFCLVAVLLGACSSDQEGSVNEQSSSTGAYRSTHNRSSRSTSSSPNSPDYASRQDWIYDRAVLPKDQQGSVAQDSNSSSATLSGDNNIVDSAQMKRYVVRPGDSLWKIAHLHKTTVDRLREVNHLTPSYILQPGKVLLIPRPTPKP